MHCRRRIVFLGPPNSGKGTQAKILAKKLQIPTISTGEMLRAAVAAGSRLGGRVEAVMARGDLVADDLMAEVVRARLGQPDAAEGFLLDGYPRTAAQAVTLEGILEEAGACLDSVILLDVPEDVLVTRAQGRGREDDSEEIVRQRLRVYQQQTAPLADLYETRGQLHRIDGDQPIEEVGRQVSASVEGGS